MVDDGSTDGTAQMMAERYGNDPRIRYQRQENAGVAAARNAALRAATGEYLAFLDSDDYWEPWKIEAQIRCLEALPEVGMVWTEMRAVSADGELLYPKYLRKMYSAYGDICEDFLFSDRQRIPAIWPNCPAALSDATVSYGDIFSSMMFGSLVHTSTVVLRRSIFEKVGYFNEEFQTGEDYHFHLRTCRHAAAALIDVSSIEYRVGMWDQLTRPGSGAELSENFLKTILPAIQNHRDRIKLPQVALDWLLAEAYAWNGGEKLQAGLPGARRALWRSLTLRIRLRTLALFAASLLPPAVYFRLRGWYRAGKQALRQFKVAPRRELAQRSS